jgi:Leucine-rich repeat (LRR) protein
METPMGSIFTRRSPAGLILALSFGAALFGCERYAITLNEQPIYTPAPLYSDYTVVDEALADCLKQTIADKKITRAEQLITLTCRHTGLRSLSGLEHFRALQELDLSHNQLQQAQTLAHLPQLRVLKINDNPNLLCESLAPLTQKELKITLPSHCEA